MSKPAWFAVLLLLLALPAAATVQETRGMRGGKPYLETTNQRTVTATVVAVDKTTRVVKLRTEAGDTVAVVAGPEVKNLAKIKLDRYDCRDRHHRRHRNPQGAGRQRVHREGQAQGDARQGQGRRSGRVHGEEVGGRLGRERRSEIGPAARPAPDRRQPHALISSPAPALPV